MTPLPTDDRPHPPRPGRRIGLDYAAPQVDGPVQPWWYGSAADWLGSIAIVVVFCLLTGLMFYLLTRLLFYVAS